MGHILFLHGASSSGKSSIAHALQATPERVFLHLSIDHFRDSGAVPGFGKDRALRAQMRSPFFDGFHHAVAAFAAAGNTVVLEHILEVPEWIGDLKALFAPFDVLFVGVICPLGTLQRREAQRGNRPLGSAARDFDRVHRGRTYDLEVDGTAPATENAARILAAFDSGNRRSDFTAART